MGKPSLYVTSHPGQLSLAIPRWLLVRCNKYQGKLRGKQAHLATH